MSASPELLGIPLAPPVDRSADTITAVLDLEEDWPVFAEHFPGNPVLPGSATVHLMLGLAQHLDPAARAMRHVRFARPLVPPARIRCTATTTRGVIVCTVLTVEDDREVVAVRGEAVSDVRAR